MHDKRPRNKRPEVPQIHSCAVFGMLPIHVREVDLPGLPSKKGRQSLL